MKYNTKALEGRMDKAIAAYENNLADVRASQANAGVLNRVTFDYYGSAKVIVAVCSYKVKVTVIIIDDCPYDMPIVVGVLKGPLLIGKA